MYHSAMNLYPSFYFLPLEEPLALSNEFNIGLRPPHKSKLPLWARSMSNIFGSLSDKEKRRILYTLHPLGLDFPEEYGAICRCPWAGEIYEAPLVLPQMERQGYTSAP